MDFEGIAVPIVVAVVAGGLLYWHILQVRKRPATSHDKLMGAVWAATLVLALGRVVLLVATGGDAPKDPAAPPAAPPAPAIGK